MQGNGLPRHVVANEGTPVADGGNENTREGEIRVGRNEPFTRARDGGRCTSWLSARLMLATQLSARRTRREEGGGEREREGGMRMSRLNR